MTAVLPSESPFGRQGTMTRLIHSATARMETMHSDMDKMSSNLIAWGVGFFSSLSGNYTWVPEYILFVT